MKKSASFVTVVTTVARKPDATRLAKLLLDRRLAACVQIFPIESHYWWQNRLEKSREYRLEAKTPAQKAPLATATLARAHPYEVPEILTLPILTGHPPYLAWLKKETTPAR